MSDAQSEPVEPEPLTPPSADAESGPPPGAADTEAGQSAGFATSAGEPEPTEHAATAAQADGLGQGSTSISTQSGLQPAVMMPERGAFGGAGGPGALAMPGGPGAPEVPVWGALSGPFMAASASSTSAKARNRALLGTGVGLGYAAIAAVTAPSTAPPTSATPTPTVTGRVSNGVHSGDLRYFLLPAPDGPSSVQGDPDGTTESRDQIVENYGGSSSVRSLLSEFGFKAACTRTYQDSTMGANVAIDLIRFADASGSAAWLSGFRATDGSGIERISVPGGFVDGLDYRRGASVPDTARPNAPCRQASAATASTRCCAQRRIAISRSWWRSAARLHWIKAMR